jgi:cobalt-zinc-cadmium efflux system membrane fusion protein
MSCYMRLAKAGVITAGVILLVGCSANASHDEKPVAAKGANPLKIDVQPNLLKQIKVGQPKWAEVTERLRVAGRVEADERRLARIGSPVTGRITNLLAFEGQKVRQGEVLATIHSTELSNAQFAFLKAYSQQELAKRAAERAKRLLSADVIGSAEVQRRDAELLQASAELSSGRAELKVLGMSDDAIEKLERARILNSEFHIVASIDGTLLERKITVGQIVQPAETAFMVADLSNVWLVADIPEQRAGKIDIGKIVKAEIPALPGEQVSGRLSFVSAIVDPETRTVRVRTNLANPDGRYKPAMLATMILEDAAERKQVIPATAVVREENQDHVFVQTAANTFVLRPVALGEEWQDLRVLKDGVEPGENIVLDGAFHLNNERKRLALQGGA